SGASVKQSTLVSYSIARLELVPTTRGDGRSARRAVGLPDVQPATSVARSRSLDMVRLGASRLPTSKLSITGAICRAAWQILNNSQHVWRRVFAHGWRAAAPSTVATSFAM